MIGPVVRRSEGVVRDTLVLFVLFLLAVVLVDPRGDFPLNDDWNFALATWHFADTGEFRFSRLTAMSLRAQVLWGALWTLAAGKSFEVLRASTLVLAAGILGLLNLLLAFAGVGRVTRWIACAAMLFHPLFFWSSFTFMTHIPYVFLSILAFYLFLKGVVEDRIGFTIVSMLAVVGSFFIRQTGIVNALAAGCVLFLCRRDLPPGRWRAHTTVVMLTVLLFVPLYLSTSMLTGYPGQIREHLTIWDQSALEAALNFTEIAIRDVVLNFQYGALLLFPLVAAFLVVPRTKSALLLLMVLSIPFLWVTTAFWSIGNHMPYKNGGEILINLGLGPPTLRDTWIERLPYPFHLPFFATTLVTFASAIGGAWLLWSLISGGSWKQAEGVNPVRTMAAQYGIAHMALATAALFVSGLYFERYVLDSLWALAVVIPILAEPRIVRFRRMCTALIVVLVLFSIGATQEYLDWNRARWAAFSDLQSRGITLARLDGGYEINQYLLGGFDGPIQLRLRGFSVIDDEFVLAFQPLPGYRQTAAYPFEGFFGLRRGSVLILERSVLPKFRPKPQSAKAGDRGQARP